MRTIIAGSHQISRTATVDAAVKASGFDVTEVISGCARGVDQAAIVWARRRSLPVIMVPADWRKYGRATGYKRNAEMAEQGAERLIAVWDGESRGTAHMIRIGRQALGEENVYVHVVQSAVQSADERGDVVQGAVHATEGEHA